MKDVRFEVLPRDECLRLLSKAPLGRVAVSVGALPMVLPVQFALVGDDVVFPADRGGELDVAARNAVVAFEADSIDPGTGWSVVATGVATEVPGAAGFLRISTEIVSGRRFLRAPLYVAGSVSAKCATVGAVARPGPQPDPGPYDGSVMEPIGFDECLRLLATEEVGRLAVVVDHQPKVFPVNYALDGDAVVFRTAPGTKLEAVSRSLVAFEVDRLASPTRAWTVTVEGLAQEITSADAPGLRERLAALRVRPWASGDRLHYVRIVPLSVTGRRLRLAANG